MKILGIERTTQHNGQVTLDRGWLLSVKGLRSLQGWCFWHHSNEAGARCIQVGPLVLEVWHHVSIHALQ
jgi:hypothetical protein